MSKFILKLRWNTKVVLTPVQSAGNVIQFIVDQRLLNSNQEMGAGDNKTNPNILLTKYDLLGITKKQYILILSKK